MRGLGKGCKVTRADVMQTHDERSKGCGLVEFATAEGARRAMLMMKDTELHGRQIFVREDPKVVVPLLAPGEMEGRAVDAAEAGSRRVYVRNLLWEVVWQDLKDYMQQAEDVQFAEVMTGRDGQSKGQGRLQCHLVSPQKHITAYLWRVPPCLTHSFFTFRQLYEQSGTGQTSSQGQS